MISSARPILPDVISLFVYDEITIFEVYEAASCSFVIIEGVSIGYQYAGSEDADDALNRAFDIIFDATLKRLKAEGIRLPPIDN